MPENLIYWANPYYKFRYSLRTEDSPKNGNIIERWIDLYGDDLFSWVLHKTSSKEVAEDLLQETFLSAFKALDSFENRSNPKTWLFSILNNKIIDYYRKRSKMFVTLESEIEKDSYQSTESMFDRYHNWKPSGFESIWSNNENLLDDPDFLKFFNDCLKDLPEKWNLAVLAKYRLGKTAEEICKDLEVTPSNYWQIIHRSKLLLKKCIEKHWE